MIGAPGARAQADAVLVALDAIVQAVIDAGVVCTRDPGEFQPPGAIVDPPTITGAATMQSLAMDVPIYVVSDQPGGLAAVDWMLPAALEIVAALGAVGATPTSWTSPINPAGLPAYLIILGVNVTTT
jgi:hypothetical protein